MAKTRESYTEHPSITVIGGKPKLRVFEDLDGVRVQGGGGGKRKHKHRRRHH